MTIFGRVVRWLRGRPVWAGNRYDPGDRDSVGVQDKMTIGDGGNSGWKELWVSGTGRDQ
jgi:hypothetical protein